MTKNNKIVSSTQKNESIKPLTNLLSLTKELELAIALSPKLSLGQSKQLQTAIIQLIKQI